MQFSHLQFERAIFEVRYPRAFVLWDTAGAIGTHIQSKWPDAKNTHAEPAKIAFAIPHQRMEWTTEIEQSRLIVLAPDHKLTDFTAAAEVLASTVTALLGVREWQRVGLRLIFATKFDDDVSAASALLGTALLLAPDRELFGAEGDVVYPEYSVQWRGKGYGITIRIKAEVRKLEFEPGFGVPLEPVRREEHRLVFDADYFTVSSLQTGQLDVASWTKSGQRIISRAGDWFFEEQRK